MNGIVFANIPNLVILELGNNVCISKKFEIKRGSNIFRRKISRNCGSANATEKQVSCIPLKTCDELGDASNCCEFEFGTVIDAPDYKFSADINYTAVKALSISHQRNVDFLPVSVHESFPGLKHYLVKNSPVSKISKKHFEKLFVLEWLSLDRNEIEVIKSDTFEDLISLETFKISTKLF